MYSDGSNLELSRRRGVPLKRQSSKDCTVLTNAAADDQECSSLKHQPGFSEPLRRNRTVNEPSETKWPKTSPQSTAKRTPKRRNLGEREDVMNKNIFRAFKRELKAMYSQFLGSNSPCQEEIKESGKSQTVLLSL